MSSRHLTNRAKKHLDFNNQSRKRTTKDHVLDRSICSGSQHNLASSNILRNCKNVYDAKVCEALRIKKLKPKLNRRLYANGCSFLLKIF